MAWTESIIEDSSVKMLHLVPGPRSQGIYRLVSLGQMSSTRQDWRADCKTRIAFSCYCHCLHSSEAPQSLGVVAQDNFPIAVAEVVEVGNNSNHLSVVEDSFHRMVAVEDSFLHTVVVVVEDNLDCIHSCFWFKIN